jgi:hypothetical protein
MSLPSNRLSVIVLVVAAVIPLHAATVSRESADEFSMKVALIQRQGDMTDRVGTLRTRLTEDELNSWLMYEAQPLLPAGLAQPQITIVGEGQLAAQAIVDLDAVARQRAPSGTFDPFSLISGTVPVTVTGMLHSGDGMARFEVQRAEVAGIPVPVAVLQDLALYYSRTPERPQGVILNDPFPLPAGILQIEVDQGQAIVVQ